MRGSFKITKCLLTQYCVNNRHTYLASTQYCVSNRQMYFNLLHSTVSIASGDPLLTQPNQRHRDKVSWNVQPDIAAKTDAKMDVGSRFHSFRDEFLDGC